MTRSLFAATALGALLMAMTSAADADQKVLIQCAGSCDAAVEEVVAAGGSVTYRYKYVDAIAATIPSTFSADTTSMAGIERMVKDVMIEAPRAVESIVLADGFEALDVAPADVVPLDFVESVALTGVGPLFGSGFTGDGVNVVVIDTGTAEVPAFNRTECPTQGPTVIGGETFIERAGPGEPSATSPDNGPHGTWVGTTVAANSIFLVPPAWTDAIGRYSPASVVELEGGLLGVPMLGTAPCARIYALKTFLSAGGGAPRSDIAAAMERAIEMRENFNAGMPSEPVSGSGTPDDPFVYDSLKVDVVNMSLGGPTLFAGSEITDRLTEKMLEVGITVVNSAGNSGHAAMTGGSAGTGLGTLTAGAASLVHNERILRDLQFGPGIGALYRPSENHQMAPFSSRGPSPDGRANVDAVANGFANFVMGPTGTTINLVNGTSFSAPTIAGAAATLRQAFPGASALQIRNALVETADPLFLGDNSRPIDQGYGFIDLVAAFNALAAGEVSDDLPSGPGGNSVLGNIASVGLQTIQLGNSGFSTRLDNLVPGEVAHFFVNVDDRVDALAIDLSNITPELPPGQQNVFFGDDLFVVVQDSITSTEAPLAGGFFADDTTLVAANPGTGLVRVAVMGDWTNAGRISADMRIRAVSSKRPKITERDRVAEGDFLDYSVTVPEGVEQANFELHWPQDWGRFPTDDLDVFVITPDGEIIVDGATFDSPERVVIDDPVPGEYILFVNGFTVWGERGNRSQFALYAFDENGEEFEDTPEVAPAAGAGRKNR
ncbi:MAG: S8 family serine peptidase [Gammaproteobacteria bacterium]|jgi:hypothetical protein